jgi:tetratricopeptide (TPR) repeat protein
MPNHPLRCLAVLLLVSAQASAIDVVVRTGGQRDGGKITKSTKTEVTITKQVGGDTVVPVNEIVSIEWDGAPATMALGRASLAAGQLDSAEKQLQQALTESAGSDNAGLRGDLDFMLARVFALRAMADASKAADAAAKLKAFLGSNRDHYRTFDAQLLSGDVALAAGDYPAAIAAYTNVAGAPWKDYQMAAQIGQGRVLLAQNNIDGAKKEFDAVASAPADTPAQKSRRLEALLGQARCLQAQQQYQPAVEALDKVIDESTAADTRIQAEAYVRQGDCYAALGGSPKDAIMAYLHVDVIPALSKESDLHAESLYHLSQLWKQAGQEERARDAAETLRGQYPESAWAKKLGG